MFYEQPTRWFAQKQRLYSADRKKSLKTDSELHNILMVQLFNTAQTKLTLQRAMMP